MKFKQIIQNYKIGKFINDNLEFFPEGEINNGEKNIKKMSFIRKRQTDSLAGEKKLHSIEFVAIGQHLYTAKLVNKLSNKGKVV